MPNIKDYSNPVQGLRPDERGTDALLQVARRGGAFFNQAGEAVRTVGDMQGRMFDSAIRQAGAVAIEHADHEQISHGASAFAGLMAQKTDEWNKTLKGYTDADGNVHPPADPNDTTLADKFRESMEGDLEKFKDSFTTDKSKAWAESRVDALRNHMFEKTTADMGTMAGEAAHINAVKTINTLGATVYSDPSSLQFARDTLKDSVNGIVASSPNLTGAAAAKVKTELTFQGEQHLVKSAVMSAITNGQDWKKIADDPKNAPYINPAEVGTFAKAAKVQEKTDLLRQKQLDAYTKQQNEAQVHAAANKNFTDNVSIDPATNRPIIKPDFFTNALKIVRDNPDAPNAATIAKTYLDWGEHQQNLKDTPLRSEPAVKQDFVDRMFSTDKPTTEIELMRAQINGKLSKDDFTAMHGMVKTLEEGPLKGPVWHDTMDAVKSELIVSVPGLPGKDVVGTNNYAKFAQSFIPDYLSKQRAGTLEPNALDVKDPNSMISKAMAPFKRTQGQRMNDYIAASGGLTMTGSKPAIPLPEADKRKVGDVYPTARGPMKWTGTGWVSP